MSLLNFVEMVMGLFSSIQDSDIPANFGHGESEGETQPASSSSNDCGAALKGQQVMDRVQEVAVGVRNGRTHLFSLDY